MFPITTQHAPETAAKMDPGLETVNGRLLHGARFHDREAVFLSWEPARRGGWEWAGTPDWRADRHSVRVGLVLSQRLAVAEGERVALALSPGVDLAVIERGIWSVGAVSVPVDPAWDLARVADVLTDARPAALFAGEREWVDALRTVGGLPDSLRATVIQRGLEEADEETLSFEEFMDYGGVLDTPERASMWRTTAAAAPADRLIALEYSGRPGDLEPARLDQRGMVEAMESVRGRLPPRKSGRRIVAEEAPTRAARALIHAGWADGLTTTVFAGSCAVQENVEALAPVSPSNGAGNALKEGGP